MNIGRLRLWHSDISSQMQSVSSSSVKRSAQRQLACITRFSEALTNDSLEALSPEIFDMYSAGPHSETKAEELQKDLQLLSRITEDHTIRGQVFDCLDVIRSSKI